jgi:hypothetical protein
LNENLFSWSFYTTLMMHMFVLEWSCTTRSAGPTKRICNTWIRGWKKLYGCGLLDGDELWVCNYVVPKGSTPTYIVDDYMCMAAT